MNQTLLQACAIQCRLADDEATNLARLEHWTQAAAAQGAQLVVPPELFAGPYFPQQEREESFALAASCEASAAVRWCRRLAERLQIVIPASFFERDGVHTYNSVAMIDADGSVLGVTRKSHIPTGPGYQEKYYFRPGNTGFRAWSTRYGRIGVGICWDQWFPEAARALVLDGAQVLVYPTAIGSEPAEPELDTCEPWRRVMIGHAVANATPVIAANRVGDEAAMTFYGSSFLADHRGDLVAELDRQQEGFVLAAFNLDAARRYRDAFGFFRDRRPDLYRRLCTPAAPATLDDED